MEYILSKLIFDLQGTFLDLYLKQVLSSRTKPPLAVLVRKFGSNEACIKLSSNFCAPQNSEWML